MKLAYTFENDYEDRLYFDFLYAGSWYSLEDRKMHKMRCEEKDADVQKGFIEYLDSRGYLIMEKHRENFTSLCNQG